MFDPERNEEYGGNRISYDKRRPRQHGDLDASEVIERAAKAGMPTRQNSLDGAEAKLIHQRLMGAYTHELDRQSENRVEMARDDDLFDHIHYTEEELEAYAERGQVPITYNITQTTVNWVLGSQRRSPTDYRVLPRKKTGAKAAEAKTELLKHMSDTNRSEFEWSNAFASAVRVGLGWMECGQGRPHEGSIVFDRAEDWRFMLWDSTSRNYDMSDARYQFRTKWLDSDLAATLWQRRAGLIRTEAEHSRFWGGLDDLGDDPMDSQEEAYFEADGLIRSSGRSLFRRRLRVIEGWFKRTDDKVSFMRGGQFHGEMFDDWSEGHWNDVLSGSATLSTQPAQVIYVALMTDSGLLALQRSPFRHNRFPFTPVWGYRRKRDGMPYGMIRGLRDIQRSFNRQKSKALHYLASTRIIVEAGAVKDIDELRVEAARPDAVIVHNQGFATPQVEVQAQMAGVHIDMARDDAALIQSVGGVTDENMGRKTNATSGIAIERRQSQGQLSTSIFFDNLRQSRGIHGEKLMVLIESYYTEKDVIRITDARGRPDWLNINEGEEDAIGGHKADFVMGEEDWRATTRQAQFDTMVQVMRDLAPTAPQLVMAIIDLVIEGSDIPKRDEIVQRIRQIGGMGDPDEDPNNPSPETAQKQAQMAEQADLMRRVAYADVASKEADARKKAADAAKAAGAVGEQYIERLNKALDAAIQVAGAPAVVAAAERVLMQAAQAEQAAGQAQQQPVAPPPPQPPMPDPQMQQGQQPPQDPAMMAEAPIPTA